MEMSSNTAGDRWRSQSALAKRMIIMLASVGVLAAIVIGYQVFMGMAQQQAMRARTALPQTVSAMPAGTQEWTPRIAAVGTLRAVNGADLALEESGIVDEINFNSGDDVEKGEVLLRLRADEELARLRSLEAAARLAEVTYERTSQLTKSQAVSQATMDTNEANLANARAQVTQQRAILEKKTIRAPFSGRLGVRAVDMGQYVNAGTSVVTLQALDPIYVDFFVPQQELDRIEVGQDVFARVDTYPDELFTGRVSAINPKVDPANRNVQVRATVENSSQKLFPGMYATVNVDAGAPLKIVAVPQMAIIYNAYGDAVFVLDETNQSANGEKRFTARQEFVTLGETRGDMVAVTSGISEGELVVTAGNTKLRNGALARIDNSIETPMETSPVMPDP